MVKVFGPMLSLDASGTIADTITFTKWKGRNVARQRVIPSNPKSGAQLGRRGMFKFTTQAWNAISTAEKATWQELADQLVASAFNAYIAFNMQRWHNYLSPTPFSPPTETDSGSDRALSAAAWEENRIKLSTTATTANEQWGIIYFASLATPVVPAVGKAIIVELDDDIANRDTFWTPPEIGVWHFNSIAFSNDGVKEAAGGAVNTGA